MMKAAVYTLLEADDELAQTLTGGIYYQIGEISRQNTPNAFDDHNEIKPCLLIKSTNDAQVGPYDASSRLTITMFFYERSGYENINTAMLRVFELLNKQRVTPGRGSCWQINWGNDIPNQEDSALGCSLGVSRYMAYRSKT